MKLNVEKIPQLLQVFMALAPVTTLNKSFVLYPIPGMVKLQY